MQIKQYSIADIHLFPSQPGVYFFYNKKKEIIYVGKAKNLKKRVTSYFNKPQPHLKTLKLVEEIHFISFTLINSEYEALLLENNLIKSNQPRYNILLKDDKTYPYLCITQERFPRLIVTRHPSTTAGQFYGPFTDLKTMHRMLELAHSLYTVRTCGYNLSEEKIRTKKFKICLEYHIRRCQGPCEGLQSEEAYNQDITQVQHLLKGNFAAVQKNLKANMQQAAQDMDYKTAQAYKEKLEAFRTYQAKSLVTNPQLGNIDVCAIVSNEEMAYLSYLQVKEGAIIFTQNAIIQKQLDEADAEILPLMLINFRTQYGSNATECLLNIPVETVCDQIKLTFPKIGDKKKLVDLAIKNVLYLKKEALAQQEDNQPRVSRALVLLQQELQLKDLPMHIECFDNSNIQGTNPVAAIVVFRQGKPAKRDYRHFNIKTVVGPDDFASMREVVGRRYQRLLEEKKPLPQLIVIDGGQGQLGAAVEALRRLGIYGQVAIIGIAKRLEEIYYPADSYPLYISKKSPALKLLQQIRDEAHRFAVTFHRQKRSQSGLKSQLENISGIGTKTIATLLQQFGSVKSIQKASLEALADHIGSKKASQIKASLK